MNEDETAIVEQKQKPGELIFVSLLFSGSVFVAYLAYSISGLSSISSPGSVPMLAAFFLLVSAAFVLQDALKKNAADASFLVTLMPKRILIFGLLTLGYVLVINLVGFVLSSLAFLFLSLVYLHRQGPLIAIVVSVNSLAVVYIVFRLAFKVILPEGSLFE